MVETRLKGLSTLNINEGVRCTEIQSKTDEALSNLCEIMHSSAQSAYIVPTNTLSLKLSDVQSSVPKDGKTFWWSVGI